MSKKDFDRYFAQVASNYHEMVLELQDMEKEFREGVVSPEVYEQMVAIIEPIKRNYQTLNYIDYLLNMPVKRAKKPAYKNQHTKQLKECITNEQVAAENKQALDELKNIFKS